MVHFHSSCKRTHTCATHAHHFDKVGWPEACGQMRSAALSALTFFRLSGPGILSCSCLTACATVSNMLRSLMSTYLQSYPSNVIGIGIGIGTRRVSNACGGAGGMKI
jgi:hypothetical protein